MVVFRGTCVDCGAGLRFAHSLRCRPCWMKIHTAQNGRPRCVDCGKPASWGPHERCQECWKNLKAARREANAALAPKCTDCGGPISTKKTKRCRTCVSKANAEARSSYRCQSCGGPVSSKSARQCQPCMIKALKSDAEARICTAPHCGQKAKAKGLCRTHYRAAQRERQGPTTRNHKMRIAKMPCASCGYELLRSHVHRVTPSLGYTNGNMVPTCARCHVEIHAGIRPCPSPIIFDTQSTSAS